MATDPRRLRPGDLCRLLNSTPLGEVITPSRLRRHRDAAGLRIGDAKHVDLLRYVAWLVRRRHAPKPAEAGPIRAGETLAEAVAGAVGATGNGSRRQQVTGHGQKLTSKQEAAIAALLTEPTHAQAATKAGISETTLYRWLRLPEFRAAYRAARRRLVDAAIGRLQAATGLAVDTLVTVASRGRRDGDRVRAAVALLEHAHRGLDAEDTLRDEADGDIADPPTDPAAIVRLLAERLAHIDRSALPAGEKTRLMAQLADALVRAITANDLAKQIEDLAAVLKSRKRKGER